ncbi:hypothetical protein [Corallococcus sp. CA047B]|uniref:hypothetical protein n=1 Tax=Corallococcus sp. CA047B TaxID=2316729 RepID=UPI0011C3CB17|nr:hypothetical protein [Corallococcus sp. CA047B]
MRFSSKLPILPRAPAPTRANSTPNAADAPRTRASPDTKSFAPRDDLAGLTKAYTKSLRDQRPDATGTPAGFNAFLKEKGMRLNVKDEGQVKMLLARDNRPAQYLQDVKTRRQDAFDARRRPGIDAPAPQTPPPSAGNPNAIKQISEEEIQQLPNRVLQDFARLGYGNSAQLLAKSPTALKRLEETSDADVRVAAGSSNGRSMTSRTTSGNKVTVYMDDVLKSGNHQAAAGTFLFEMNNAHRWDRFETLNTRAKQKVGTAPEYAQKKMEVEVEGMLHTGKCANELLVGKHAKMEDMMTGWYLGDYISYDKKVKDLPESLTKDERRVAISDLRSAIALERLDVRHGTGPRSTSHREVYERQFNTAR